MPTGGHEYVSGRLEWRDEWGSPHQNRQPTLIQPGFCLPQVCAETYGVAPEVFISGDRRFPVPYIPSHFDYIVYEVLKNSARAVVERHLAAQSGPGASHRVPPIRVRICKGDEHVVLRISDEGGGIPKDLESRIWQFGFTTIGCARLGACWVAWVRASVSAPRITAAVTPPVPICQIQGRAHDQKWVQDRGPGL